LGLKAFFKFIEILSLDDDQNHDEKTMSICEIQKQLNTQICSQNYLLAQLKPEIKRKSTNPNNTSPIAIGSVQPCFISHFRQ